MRVSERLRTTRETSVVFLDINTKYIALQDAKVTVRQNPSLYRRSEENAAKSALQMGRSL